MRAHSRDLRLAFALIAILISPCGCMSVATQGQESGPPRVPQSQEMDFTPSLKMKIEQCYWAATVNPIDDYAAAYSSVPAITGQGLKPQDSFLVVDLAITNYASQPLTATRPPIFVLVASDGRTYDPISQITGLTSKMLMDGNVNPGHSTRGRAVFDVPTGSYDLRVELGTFARGYVTTTGPLVWTWILTPTPQQGG